jgi:hypothetical protein
MGKRRGKEKLTRSLSILNETSLTAWTFKRFFKRNPFRP